MAAAKGRGRPLGRKPALSPGQVEHARLLTAEGEPVKQVARTLKVHRATLYRAAAK
jgi:DNA invertase Pin-like site-specific DNA recombinase